MAFFQIILVVLVALILFITSNAARRSRVSLLLGDLRIFRLMLRLSKLIDQLQQKEFTIAQFFKERVQKTADGKAFVFIYDDGSSVSYTFRQLDQISNQVANFLRREIESNFDLKNQDKDLKAVSVIMENKPEFIITVIALMKLGLEASLVNVTLKGNSLLHSLTVINSPLVIVGSEQLSSVRDVIDQLPQKARVFLYSKPDANSSIGNHPMILQVTESLLEAASKADPVPIRTQKWNDVTLYIYTSGTTGLPKAVRMTNRRLFSTCFFFTFYDQAKVIPSQEKLYCPLPLYHTAALLGLMACWHSGYTYIFRRSFSVSKFWKDVRDHECTVFQYIGELCRYLITQPEDPQREKNHKLRLAFGNGMKADVWQRFQKRSGIPQIIDFYSSSEGNIFLANTKNRCGAVGFKGIISGKGLKIIRVNDQGEPLRDPKTGFCIECEKGEAGEAVKLIDEKSPFVGYTDAAQTEKKILSNAFKKGDKWFRSGDMLKLDKFGFFYFVDRMGDTFRWKGQNVSTTEIENIIGTCKGVKEAVVYGVDTKVSEGKAGMATLVVESLDQFDLNHFYNYLHDQLPRYAIPLFLRLHLESPMETTSTYKYKKQVLVAQGFNPDTLLGNDNSVCLLFGDHSLRKYVPLDRSLYQKILSGEVGI